MMDIPGWLILGKIEIKEMIRVNFENINRYKKNNHLIFIMFTRLLVVIFCNKSTPVEIFHTEFVCQTGNNKVNDHLDQNKPPFSTNLI